jgi:enterochelin esterase-like enzyme
VLRQMGVQKVALVGGSVGGLSALRAGLDADAEADGIICLSGSGWTEITASVAGLQVPVLYVAARDDFPAFELTDDLYGAATSAKSRKLALSTARCTPTCCYSPLHQRSHRWRPRY